jgi:hypothetical protein
MPNVLCKKSPNWLAVYFAVKILKRKLDLSLFSMHFKILVTKRRVVRIFYDIKCMVGSGSLAIIRLSKFAFQAVYTVLECLGFVCGVVAGGKGDDEK